MFAPLSILSILGNRAVIEESGVRAIVDYAGFNLNIGSLTGNEASQQSFAVALTALFPQDQFNYMRNNMYGISFATGSYPAWMSTASSYHPNMFRRVAPANYHADDRRLIAEPLSGFNGQGMGPQASPFGRTSDKARVADNVNTWRSSIRWRARVLLSDDVGVAVAPMTPADLAAVKDTNAKTTGYMGPNEIDAVINWKQFYLDFVNNPDEITTSTPFATIKRPDTVFAASLSLLFLRIADHMQHTWEGVNDSMAAGGAGRTNCAVFAPAIIRTATGLSASTDWTCYDWLQWEDYTANVLLRRGEWLKWCDATQVHIHVDQSTIEDPWVANPVGTQTNAVTPWHWWTAKLACEAYRIGLGLDPLKRPIIEGETGIPVQAAGINVDGRHDLNQLRSLKYGVLATSALYWGCVEILFYTPGLSTAYGYNLMAYGGLSSVMTFSISPTARGTGYVVGTVYELNYGSGNDVRPTFKVLAVTAGGAISAIEIQFTGYVALAPVATAQLVTPSGGTAATLVLTWTTTPRFTHEGASVSAPAAPAQAVAAGAVVPFFNDDFTSLNFYHPTNNPSGTWRFNDSWQNSEQAGYVDFAGNRCFVINQMTTGLGATTNSNDAAAAASVQPYLPASQLDNTTMRLKAQRALLSTRAALRTTVNTIATAQGRPIDEVTWLGTWMTTERFNFDRRYDFNRTSYTEFRMRFLPANMNGVHASIWLYTAGSESHPAGDGKETVEIDIMESDDVQTTLWKTNIHKTAAQNIPLTHNQSWMDGNFHTYGLLWEPNSLKVYFDNVLSQSLIGADADWFSVPMRLMIQHTPDPYWAPGLGIAVPVGVNETYMDIDRITVWTT